jgi:hypothetical protein
MSEFASARCWIVELAESSRIRLTAWPVVPLEVSVTRTSLSGTDWRSCDLKIETGR